jgi:TatD DNase family protein
MYVDSHCHLSFPELSSRLPQVLADMAAADVHAALCICTTMEEFPQVHALARSDGRLWCTVGVHPDSEGVHEPTVDELLQAAGHERVVGIGETGLDYYRLGTRSVADMEWQRERFRVHIRAARRCGLPLVVHTRSAAADTLALVRDEGQGRVGGVFHCFTETREVARAALDLGFMISFSGILTFRNAEELREVARMVPLDRCLIETDSPYLAPAPHRGKVNSPAWVPLVAARLAELKGLAVEDVALQTQRNFEQLFPRVRAGAEVHAS